MYHEDVQASMQSTVMNENDKEKCKVSKQKCECYVIFLMLLPCLLRLLQSTLGGAARALVRILVAGALVELLVRWGHIVGGVVLAEVVRLQVEGGNLGGHDGEVLNSGVVGEAKGVPDDNVVIDNVVPILDPGLDTLSANGLVGVVTSREQLTVLVLGDPDRGLAELGSAPVPGTRLSEKHLRADGHKLVASGGQRHPVLHVGVDNLEDTTVGKAVLNSTSSVNCSLLADVACT